MLRKISLKISEINIYLLCTSLVLLFFIIFYSTNHYTDTTITTGDDHGYQMLAVNFVEGRGVMVNGIYGKTDRYKLDFTNNQKEENLCKRTNIEYDFYRTPGFPVFFLGILYKITGISPYLAKTASLFILCIVAGFIPLLWKLIWGNKFIWLSIFAGISQIFVSYQWAERIGTEPLIIFALFLISISILIFQKKPNILSSLLVGTLLAWGLLVKGSLIFLPMILFAYFFTYFLKKRIKSVHLLTMVSIFIIILSCWAKYASEKAHKTVVLSTQGSVVLLDGNNEYTQGGWEPRWAEHKESFYNNDGMEKSSIILRICNFYLHHLSLFPVLMFKKLLIGFVTQLFTCLIFIIWLFLSIQKSRIYTNSPNIIHTLLGICLIAFSVFHIYTLHTSAFLWKVYYFLLTNKLVLSILVGTTIFYIFTIKSDILGYIKNIPFVIWSVWANFILLSLVIFGESRFVAVMSFLFALYFFHLLSMFISRAKIKTQKG